MVVKEMLMGTFQWEESTKSANVFYFVHIRVYKFYQENLRLFLRTYAYTA